MAGAGLAPATAAPSAAVPHRVGKDITTGVTADFEMNEPVGSTVMTDSSGNGNNGSIDPTGIQTGAQFDGATGYNWEHRSPTAPPASPERVIQVPDDIALEPGNQDFTLEIRYRTKENFGNIIQKGQATSKGGQWKIQNPGGVPSCLFQGSLAQVATSSKTPLNDNEWHTLTCVLTQQGVSMYVDGVFRNKKNGTIGTLDNSIPMTVGGKINCDQVDITCDYFSGQIDYVMITKGASSGNLDPTAAFSPSCDALACSFDSSASADPDGSIASYAWTFGDGATSTLASPSHSYAAAGTYTVKLTVTDNLGATDTATHSVTVDNGAPPGKPRLVSAVAGNSAATVSWSAPSSLGDSDLTGYVVTASPGGRTCATVGLSCSVTGLTNGQAYTFTVVASNAAGPGPASDPSSPVTPAGDPSAPGDVTAQWGNHRVTVGWSAADPHGSPVTSYVVTQSPGGATKTVDATDTSVVFTSLTNGTAYSYTVAAVNAVGTGPTASSPSVRPAGPPLQVKKVTAKAQKKSVLLTWAAAAPNGRKVLSYEVVASNGRHRTVDGTVHRLVFRGLTTGHSLRFRIHAVNAAGTGPWSAWTGTVKVR